MNWSKKEIKAFPIPFIPLKINMRKRQLFLFALLVPLLFPLLLSAQNPQAYIQKYKDIAISEMHRTGVPASITLAQGILESASGTSKLAVKGRNHFGIKASKDWNGKCILRKGMKFRKYKRVEECFKDHSDFLVNRSRYDFLFEYDRTDYKKWAKGLQKAGYATDRAYPKKLISLIERYELFAYDKM